MKPEVCRISCGPRNISITDLLCLVGDLNCDTREARYDVQSAAALSPRRMSGMSTKSCRVIGENTHHDLSLSLWNV